MSGNIAKTFLNLAWNQGHLNVLREQCHGDFTFTSDQLESELNLDGFILHLTAMRESLAECEFMTHSTVVNGNVVKVQGQLSGVLKQNLFELKGQGQPVELTLMNTFTLQRGKIKALDNRLLASSVHTQDHYAGSELA